MSTVDRAELEDRIFAELDDHLNNGCVDHRCRYNPAGIPEFDGEFIQHLAESILETLDEEGAD